MYDRSCVIMLSCYHITLLSYHYGIMFSYVLFVHTLLAHPTTLSTPCHTPLIPHTLSLPLPGTLQQR